MTDNASKPKTPAARKAAPRARARAARPAPATRLYIAYGSNLNVGQMAMRCPRARKVGALVLPDWKLVFRGVADIEPELGAELQCGVWRVTPQCEDALDRYEGISSGLYRREFLTLRLRQNGVESDEEALVYLMNRTGYAIPGDYYFDVIRQGFRDFGLPEESLMQARGEVEVMSRRRRNEWEWPPRQAKSRRRNPVAEAEDFWSRT